MAGPRKTIDQKIQEIDQKIAFHEDKIDALKKKKDELLCPISYQDIINEAKRQRIPPQKIVDTLGFKITPKKNKRSTQPGESEQGE